MKVYDLAEAVGRKSSKRAKVHQSQDGARPLSPETPSSTASSAGDLIGIHENAEEVSAYARILAGLRDSLKPEGQMEQLLIEKIAADQRRLRRALAFEAALLRREALGIERHAVRAHREETGRIGGGNDEIEPLEFLDYSQPVSEADIAAVRRCRPPFRPRVPSRGAGPRPGIRLEDKGAG